MVEHLGYISVDAPQRIKDVLVTEITTDADLVRESQEALRQAEIITDDRLTATQLAHLELARAIAKRAHGGVPVRGVFASIIPPASDRVRTAGMYSRNTQEIYIDLNQLDSGHNTVDTVIHELAHHTSGAEDLTEPHSVHMTRLAGYVVDLTHAGDFDELMESVTW